MARGEINQGHFAGYVLRKQGSETVPLFLVLSEWKLLVKREARLKEVVATFRITSKSNVGIVDDYGGPAFMIDKEVRCVRYPWKFGCVPGFQSSAVREPARTRARTLEGPPARGHGRLRAHPFEGPAVRWPGRSMARPFDGPPVRGPARSRVPILCFYCWTIVGLSARGRGGRWQVLIVANEAVRSNWIVAIRSAMLKAEPANGQKHQVVELEEPVTATIRSHLLGRGEGPDLRHWRGVSKDAAADRMRRKHVGRLTDGRKKSTSQGDDGADFYKTFAGSIRIAGSVPVVPTYGVMLSPRRRGKQAGLTCSFSGPV